VASQDRIRLGGQDVDEWRLQEPKNAHSHLLSMLLGNSLSIPVVGGDLTIGEGDTYILNPCRVCEGPVLTLRLGGR
jgi:hypothetical protein